MQNMQPIEELFQIEIPANQGIFKWLLFEMLEEAFGVDADVSDDLVSALWTQMHADTGMAGQLASSMCSRNGVLPCIHVSPIVRSATYAVRVLEAAALVAAASVAVVEAALVVVASEAVAWVRRPRLRPWGARHASPLGGFCGDHGRVSHAGAQPARRRELEC